MFLGAMTEGPGEAMDIDILLALQSFRDGAGSVLADFLMKMTFLGEVNSALVIMAIV